VEPGCEWIVDAYGCDPSALGRLDTLKALFERLMTDLRLQPVAEAVWHQFPDAGGITGVVVLSESHLTVHTFPERGFAALSLYCCKPRPDWPWAQHLADALGATDVRVSTHIRGTGRT
jgi:S-adenosylmethionine decarboxylase